MLINPGHTVLLKCHDVQEVATQESMWSWLGLGIVLFLLKISSTEAKHSGTIIVDYKIFCHDYKSSIS